MGYGRSKGGYDPWSWDDSGSYGGKGGYESYGGSYASKGYGADWFGSDWAYGGKGAAAASSPYLRPMPKGGKPWSNAFVPARSAEPDGPSADPDEGRMISVGGLPTTAEWQELKDHMKQVGKVEFVQVLTDKGQGNTGFVRYSNVLEAQAAIAQLDGSMMAGMGPGAALQVDLWTGPKPSTVKGHSAPVGGKPAKGFGFGGGKGFGFGKFNPAMFSPGFGSRDPSFKVRVEGLPAEVQWQELKDHMAQAGTVEFTNVKNGVGEVRFSNAEFAQNAISLLNGSELCGTLIVVDAWT